MSPGLIDQSRELAAYHHRDSVVVFAVRWFGPIVGINSTTLTALALGACSVASAILLILELRQPYTGSIRISPVVLEQVILELDK